MRIVSRGRVKLPPGIIDVAITQKSMTEIRYTKNKSIIALH